MKPIHNSESSTPTNIVDLSTALPCLKDSAAWKKRAEDVRENEWALYQKSLAVLHQALDRMLARPFDPITIRELCNLIEVAFALGRRAVGLPAQGTDKDDPNGDAAFMREVDHMLNKIYRRDTTAQAARSDPIGRDAAPPASASVARPSASTSSPAPPPAAAPSNTAAPPGDPTANNVVTDVVPKTHQPASLPPQTDSGPVAPKPNEGGQVAPKSDEGGQVAPKSDEGGQVAPKSDEGGTEVPPPPKHKPYWLNGHYYANPEYPESVARAIFTNSQQSARRGAH